MCVRATVIFAGKVTLYSQRGDRMRSLKRPEALGLYEAGDVEVCDVRRGLVFGLRLNGGAGCGVRAAVPFGPRLRSSFTR